MSLSVEEVIGRLKPRKVYGKISKSPIKGASIDSRNILPGGIFFAFAGELSDGHNFVTHAAKNGASCIIVSKIMPEYEEVIRHGSACIILVDDVLLAMQNLAKLARSKFSGKVIAVTGSIGKTTTKEMIAYILSKFFNTSYSSGNKNNHIGLPMSILNSDSESSIWVLEMGMNNPNEIAPLSEIAKPDISVITTIAPAHIGNFNSMEDIADAKSEIFLGMGQGGIAILNQANEYFPRLVANAKKAGLKTILGLGMPQKSPIYIDNYKMEFNQSTFDVICETNTAREVVPCSLPSISHHVACNTVFIFAIAKFLKLNLIEVAKYLGKFKGVDGRGNIETIMSDNRKIIVIDDSYNASPESVKSAILVLKAGKRQYGASRSVCVLGDMLELGQFSQTYHSEVGSFAANTEEIDTVFCIGQESRYIYDQLPNEKKGGIFENSEVAQRPIRDSLKDGDIVLFKASRGMKLERIIKKLYQA